MLYRTMSRPVVLRAPEGAEGASPAAVSESARNLMADAQHERGPLDIGGAVALLRQRREEAEATPATNNTAPATPAQAGAGERNSGEEPEAATPDEEAGGHEEADDTVSEPAIDPPIAWTKEEKEAFKALPRDVQATIAARERDRRAEIDRRLNEANERTKAADAKAQEAEQARQQYEAALPNALAVIHNEFATRFPDVQSWADVQRLSVEDPNRYLEFDALSKRSQVLQAEYQAAQERQQTEIAHAFESYVTREAEAFLAKAPEFRDPEKAPRLQADVRATLTGIGFADDEIAAAWSGQPISMRDHRVQLLIRDAMRYRKGQEALKKAAPKAVPPPQRPGNAPAKGEAAAAQITEFKEKLARTGRVEDAVALLRARRRTG